MSTQPLKPIIIDDSEYMSVTNKGGFIIDKTEQALHLIRSFEKSVSLSRPPLTGKTFLTSTLEQIYNGNKSLFANTNIGNSNYKFHPHKVLRLDFKVLDSTSVPNLQANLINTLISIGNLNFLTLPSSDLRTTLTCLISELYQMGHDVVVLIDSYDSPFLNNLGNPTLQAEIKDFLNSFYSILESNGDKIKKIILLGITEYVIPPSFIDLTHDQMFIGVLGVNLDDTFTQIDPYLDKKISLAAQDNVEISMVKIYNYIMKWYYGYKFSTHSFILVNTFSLLSYLASDSYEFKSYWFQAAQPYLPLIANIGSIIGAKGFSTDECIFVREKDRGISVKNLLFDFGYLSIQEKYRKNRFKVSFPNLDVLEGFERVYENKEEKVREEFEELLKTIGSIWEKEDPDVHGFLKAIERLTTLDPPFLSKLVEDKGFPGNYYRLAMIMRLERAGGEVLMRDGINVDVKCLRVVFNNKITVLNMVQDTPTSELGDLKSIIGNKDNFN